MFCDARVCYRLMVVVLKAMHTANMHNILLESLLRDVLMCFNGCDTQAIDVLTFDFKGIRVL